ncbi:MAG: hypothetical protein NW200_12430, partial [Hyphomonadaceae bacterium]|nr:hypothetical protein [Hyphomonadaceae bacterium]
MSFQTGTPRFTAAAVLAALILILTPETAAACQRWNASGEWTVQLQNWISVRMRIEQNRDVITGQASYMQRVGLPEDVYPDSGTGERLRIGRVDGRLEGDRITMQIRWTRMVGDRKQYIGLYEGKISRHGRAEGVSTLVSHPYEPPLNWYVDRRFPCNLIAPHISQTPPRVANAPPGEVVGAMRTDEFARRVVGQGTDNPGSLANPPLAKNAPAAPPPRSARAAIETPPPVYQAPRCRSGYVWREARPG